MKTTSEIAQEVLCHTKGGITIIRQMFPQANTHNAFKLRNERTASCFMHRMTDGTYILKDFGSGESGKNAIQLYADENGLDYTHATLQLAKQFSVNTINEQ